MICEKFLMRCLVLFFSLLFSCGLANASEIQNVLKAAPLVERYHSRRDNEQVWINKDKNLKLARQMLDAINSAGQHGLNPKFYHQKEITELLSGEINDRTSADLELLLTDSFFMLGSHLSYGLVDPISFRILWSSDKGEEDLMAALDEAVRLGNVKKVIANFSPSNVSYLGLINALSYYESLKEKGGWSRLSGKKGDKLEIGADDERVKVLRERLKATGELKNSDGIFDGDVQKAVSDFQRRHGLNPDGVVGKHTADALSVTAEERVCQLKISLDRLRAFSRLLQDERYIFVNIPDFSASVIEAGKTALVTKAIVGMPSRKTPMMKGEVGYLIFNPKWHIPKTILLKDKVPEILKDPSYLNKHRMKVYLRENGVSEELDPAAIDWSEVNEHNTPYLVVQDSGDYNALGRVKFMFPNKYDVYMHDTPTRDLFEKDLRMFSSGCIRIEKPVDLAQYLLRDQPEFTLERIGELMKMNHERVVELNEKISIYLLYLTAWTDEEGRTQFRFDVYGHDKRVKGVMCDLR